MTDPVQFLKGERKRSSFAFLAKQAETLLGGGLYPNEKGPMLGILAGVKPGFKLSMDREWDKEAFKKKMAFEGQDVLVLDKLVVDIKQLNQRLVEEKDLAIEVGWDFEQSMEDNLARVSTYKDASVESQALAGFVLGYPESSIKGYARQQEFKKKSIPLPCELWDSDVKVDTKSWDPGDSQILETMRGMRKMIYDQYKQNRNRRELDQNILMFRQSYENNLKQIYERYFELSSEEINFLLSEREVNIVNSNEEIIYHFSGFLEDGQEPEDVKALRMKVAQGFRNL